MLFDTNIFIYADRGIASAKDLILSSEIRAISAVTYMEYVPFCRNKNELAIFDRLLESLKFRIYDIDSDISVSARMITKQFSLSHSVEMGDALIAATALKYSATLCTSNIKHFKPISGISIEHYRPEEVPG